MNSKYDAIIIGAGHNGLVTAAYLARAGRKVLVLERRELVGGCVVTEELWPGFKVSTASYVNSLFRPEIIRDLELKRHGFAMLPRSPSSFTPLPDGRYLMMGPDKELTHREVSKFSRKDAESLPRYEAMLERIAAFLEPMLVETPPDPWSMKPGNLAQLARIAWNFRKLGRDGKEALEILTSAADPILDRWFESEEVKTTLSTDAIIGAFATPSMPGTAYILFHHVMGECDGVRGVWGYMKGGMGALSESLANACAAYGATIHLETPVEQITAAAGRATGVVAGGRQYAAKLVISGADPNITFNRLLDPAALPDAFLNNVRRINYDSASVKINLALSELPNFTAYPGIDAGPQHRGTIHICPDFHFIDEAYADSVSGKPSRRPILECTIPSVVDPSIAPPGKHVMNIFTQYGPYSLRNGLSWETEREAYADRCIELLAEYAPNIRNAILHREVLTP